MSFQQDLEQDTIASRTLREAVIVEHYTLVRAAVAMMRHMSLGCAVIVDYRRRPSGIFTKHSVIDVLIKTASLKFHPVREEMTADPAVVYGTDPAAAAVAAIAIAGHRHVPVMGIDEKVIGVIGPRRVFDFVEKYFDS